MPLVLRPSCPASLRAFLCLIALLLAIGCDDEPETAPADAEADAEQAPDLASEDDALPVGKDAADFSGSDGLGCPGGPGCSCLSNGNCDNLLCIEAPDGKQCAQYCTETCPTGSTCQLVSDVGPDSVSICVPKWGKACNPCSASTECKGYGATGGVCVDYGALGRYCGANCGQDSDCPGGYACQERLSVEGQKAKQCVKVDGKGELGVCTCSALAITQQLKTSCLLEAKDATGKVIGTCPGERVCSDKGLSECIAPAPKPEICDGQDNDCNGQTDEKTCDDTNICTQDSCNAKLFSPEAPGKPAVEGCVHAPLDTLCDADGNPCTVGDACKNGQCQPGAPKTCDDGNPCTKDSCDAAGSCTTTVDDGVPCSDGNPCTIGDACKGGDCGKGKPADCDPGKPCVVGTCDLGTGACTFADQPNGLNCDDGLPCTDLDVCASGQCAGKVKSCNDDNVCTDEACDPVKGCVYVQNKLPCDDGNACTQSDKCLGGLCKGQGLNCDDGNSCTADSCDGTGTGCENKPLTSACTDGDACTVGDVCKGGQCVTGPPKVCDDKSACSVDSCDSLTGACKFEGAIFEGTACDADASICTVGDKCAAGKCIPGKVKNCDDNNPCTDDDCHPDKGCQKVPNAAPCNADDNPCTENDGCQGGACLPGKDKACDDANPCTADACVLATGKCAYTGVPNEGKPCDADGSVCTMGDKCSSGKCTVGKAKTCDDGNPCTDDACDPKADCQASPNSDPCDDGALCTIGDVCSGGKCLAGKPKICDDKNQCTEDGCNPTTGGCVYDAKALENLPCNADNSVCTVKDTCLQGTCAVGQAQVCDDKNPCTTDSCDPVKGCVFQNNSQPCNDGNACTQTDLCSGGACQGTAVNCDDGNLCTVDSCDAKVGCLHGIEAQEGKLCGPDKTCVGGVCKLAVCGDAKVQSAVEKCDGDNLAGQNCGTLLGAGSDGVLKCTMDCKAFDTSGCTVDLSWMDTSDGCKGFRQAKLFANVRFAVSKSSTWTKAKNYSCPKGYHWASTAEGQAIFKGSPLGTETVYYSQCGWTAGVWNGLDRRYFRFSDSQFTNAHKHAGNLEGYKVETLDTVDLFAGIVCVAD